MAKSKTVWLDRRDHQYDSAREADEADARYSILDAFEGAGIEVSERELSTLEHYNLDHIKPFKDYFDKLYAAAEARMGKPSC
jgi:hypothetical protein